MCCRRTVLVVSLALLTGGCAPDPETESPTLETSRPPAPINVLLVTLDTTRADRIGCYGYERAGTPTIDALAAAGVRFDDARCQVPLTLPSHVSLMTSTYPLVSGVRVNGEVLAATPIATLAERLSAAGHRTAAFIAAFPLDRRFGLARGFDHYDDDLGAAAPPTGHALERPANIVCDAATGWLEDAAASDDGPFFAWVHLFDPHWPYEPPPPYDERYESRYDGEIAFTDSQVARLIATLDRLDLRSSTLIVLAGDHGEAFGEHGERQHGLFVYDTTIRVPMVVCLPEQVPAGVTVAAPVGLIDVTPTILDLLDHPPADDLDGRSLVATWSRQPPPASAVYSESHYPLIGYGWAPLMSLTTEAWTYIDAPEAELYDRAADPGELENVLAAHPDVSRRLSDRLDEMVAGMTPRSDTTADVDDETRRLLQSLGYLSGTTGTTDADRPRRDPKSMLDVYNAHADAVALAIEGDTAGVVALLEPLVERSPESDELQISLARAYLELGRLQEAERAFAASLRSLPDAPTQLAGLGESLRLQGRLDEAMAAYSRAVAIDDRQEEAIRGMTLTHAAAGRMQEALASAQRHVEIAPDSPNALVNLAGLSMQGGALDQAVPLLERALEIEPANPIALATLWQLLMTMGRQAEAIDVLRRAVALHPDDATLICPLCWFLATSSDDSIRSVDEALEFGQRCRDANPQWPNAWDALAAAQAAAGRFDDAIVSAERAIELARQAGDQRLVALVESRLARYRQGEPHRE